MRIIRCFSTNGRKNMTEQELASLIKTNLELAFKEFDKVSDNGCSKDNGDTKRIISLLKEENL